MCFQPVHHSLRLVPAKCFIPEEQGMFVFFHVTNATAPSERTSRDFFSFACKISLSFSESVHALAHLKFTFPNTND